MYRLFVLQSGSKKPRTIPNKAKQPASKTSDEHPKQPQPTSFSFDLDRRRPDRPAAARRLERGGGRFLLAIARFLPAIDVTHVRPVRHRHSPLPVEDGLTGNCLREVGRSQAQRLASTAWNRAACDS